MTGLWPGPGAMALVASSCVHAAPHWALAALAWLSVPSTVLCAHTCSKGMMSGQSQSEIHDQCSMCIRCADVDDQDVHNAVVMVFHGACVCQRTRQHERSFVLPSRRLKDALQAAVLLQGKIAQLMPLRERPSYAIVRRVWRRLLRSDDAVSPGRRREPLRKGRM
jgi:hypothetical protein